MTSTSESQPRHGGRGGFLEPALYVSIAIAVFAVVTQLLYATGAASLSTTEQLAIWLVAAALIVLIWVAYMICRAYVTQGIQARQDAEHQKALAESARADAERARAEARAYVEQARAEANKAGKLREEAPEGPVQAPNGGRPRNNGRAGQDEDAWVPPDELRHLIGKERPVSMAEVFPSGCYLEPDSIRPDVEGKLNGQRAYQCRVVDPNPALKDRTPQAVVKILTSQEPFPPTGQPFERVEFEDLRITPYVTDRNPMRIRYSLRAAGIHATAAEGGSVA
jgi:hypothetical protein